MEPTILNLIPDKTSPVTHASQYDAGRVKRFMLYDGALPYTLTGEETVELHIRKPNGEQNVFEVENTGESYLDLTLTEEMTDMAGRVYCKFHIDDLATKSFFMEVEPGPARIYIGHVDGEIAEFETDLEEDIIILNVELSPIQDFNGYDAPWAPGCGKNIAFIDPTTLDQIQRVKNVSYSDGGMYAEVDGTFARVMYAIPTEIGKTYTISFLAKATSSYRRIHFQKSNASWSPGNSYTTYYIGFDVEETFTYTFEATTECAYLGLYITANDDTDGYMYIKYVQLEEGSSATNYAPYSNICPISGRTTAKMFRNSGNLVDDSIKYVYSASIVYIGTDGHYNTFLRAGTYRASVDFSGERYGLYCRSAEVGNIMIWGSNSGAHESTFVIPKDDYYRFWSYYNPSLGTIDVNKIKWVKVEPGNITTKYEPYVISPTPVTINFNQTVYSGVIDYTAQVIRAVGKLVKISDYEWTRNSQLGFFVIGINDMERNPDSGKKLNGLVSEAYVNRNAAQAGSQRVNNSIAGWQNQLRIRDDTYDNVTDFVNAMGNTHFLYPLKTPIEIPFSGYTPIPTLKGKNIVYSDSGPVEVAYHKMTQEGGND